MCGIFAILGNAGVSYSKQINEFMKLKHRGPDHSETKQIANVFLGFHRLKINDQSSAGNQPMEYNNIYLVCNGEIYNYDDLQTKHQFPLASKSDCEIILHLYNHYKKTTTSISSCMNLLCNDLDGEFAFVLYDSNDNVLVSARDPYGVRPLFCGNTEMGVCFASELKGISELSHNPSQCKPGWFSIYDSINLLNSPTSIPYHTYNNLDRYCLETTSMMFQDNYSGNLAIIQSNLEKAVSKRVANTDSPEMVCGLLSGGLDSSLVCALASKHFPPGSFKTFSVGMKGSTDIYFAEKVAEYIKSDHTTIVLDKEDFLNAIDETIRIIESYDTTTVRASVGNYLISKHIKENHPEIKVVLNGDYSDEVAGGYKYLKYAQSDTEFDTECRSLLENIHYFDSLRSDRTISSQGLEARTPFADKRFVLHYLSLPTSWRTSNSRLEKSLLRQAFYAQKIIPDDILFREKEAFSDGVSSTTESWHTIVQTHIQDKVTDEEQNQESPQKTKEQLYYRKVFDSYYPHPSVIPYYWMPKFCNVSDPSAREIKNVF